MTDALCVTESKLRASKLVVNAGSRQSENRVCTSSVAVLRIIGCGARALNVSACSQHLTGAAIFPFHLSVGATIKDLNFTRIKFLSFFISSLSAI